MTNRKAASERKHTDDVVRVILVHGSGKVTHRDAHNARGPWDRGAGWGRPGAHAVPSEDAAPAAPTKKPKDPKKVAAGKARAAQAAGRSGGKFVKTAKVTVAKSKAGKVAKPKAKTTTASESGEAMVVIAFRGTPAQKEKLGRLGGGEWMRKRIDAASA
jgi:hypothetical protein